MLSSTYVVGVSVYINDDNHVNEIEFVLSLHGFLTDFILFILTN